MAEYIERDEAIRKAQDACIKIVFRVLRRGITQFDAADIVDIMESVPVADVVEVKHGEWEEEKWCDNFQHTCSLCHSTARVHPQSVAYKYCPYCGAKMDGRSDTK